VTDDAANMGAYAKKLRLHPTNCVAHTLNVLIKRRLTKTVIFQKSGTSCLKKMQKNWFTRSLLRDWITATPY